MRATAVGSGLLACGAMWLFDGAIDSGLITVPAAWPFDEYDLGLWVLLSLFFVPPSAIQTAFYRRMWAFRKGLLFGVWYGTGWACAMMADILLLARAWPGGDISLATWAKHCGSYVLAIMIASMAISLLSWSGNRLLRGRPVVLDAPLCPQCGYSLRGSPSGVCLECGWSRQVPGLAPRDGALPS
jgi:hypothetical protein